MNIYIGLCSSRFDIRFKKSIRGIQNIKIPKNICFILLLLIIILIIKRDYISTN